MKDIDLKALLKRVVELVMPDLRSYYRVVRKARVIKSYASAGQYWADVQPLRNDESVDASEPVIPRVEIPVMWAGLNRGIVCPPTVGTYCDLEYYDGDPNFPRISNFRWHGMTAPTCEINALIIQKQPGVSFKIDSQNQIILTTPQLVMVDAPETLFTGNVQVKGNVQVDGNVHADGSIIDSGGNTNHHGH